MEVMGISGLPGSGKSLVSEIAAKKGAAVVSMGDIIREEAKKRGESSKETATNLRKEHGKYIVAKLTIEKIKKMIEDKLATTIIVEGIRSPFEVNMFKENFDDFIILSIFANPAIRFKRLQQRNREDDSENYEDFLKRDQMELDFGIGTVISLSDKIIINEKDLESYEKEINEFLNENEKKEDKVIEEKAENEMNNNKWKRRLMITIAKNFRCDVYYNNNKLVIVGAKEDILISKRVYLYAKEAILKSFRVFFKNNYEVSCISSSMRNRYKREYALGFIKGLSEKFEAQKVSSELALVVTNPKVKEYINNIELTPTQAMIAEQILQELNKRLQFLIDVGLDYLTLSRPAGSLSGGEAQRIRLATQIGAGLTGVLYILDEPSIGLHQRDNDKLIATLKKLRDLGNSVIVVEHDEDTMYAADQIIDIGPGAGVHGGNVMAQGTAEEIKNTPGSITGDYLSGRKQIVVPKKRRKSNGKSIEVVGATEHNLKNITAKFPLGQFICVTGVSGSGKSTLVNEILYKTIARDLNGSNEKPGKCKQVKGLHNIDKIVNIDQSPIGRTPRSNPATYTGVFDMIRDLFAGTNEAKMRGYDKGRFSFNVPGGRCEACSGDGVLKIEMHFLSDIYVPCEVCKGKRYNKETLEVKYKGKSISDVLDMTVEEALEFFDKIPRIKSKIQTLYDVGLGYIKLGQPSTTLSGGEAQRVKLATELSKKATGKTLYILDEPTTGLHIADVHRLVDILQRLVDTGNTIIVIEHNLDLIKTCDHIIDLGPEGGDKGGQVIAVGTPEHIVKNEDSYTGKFLKKYLN